MPNERKVQCGTESSYVMHIRRRETPCDPCRVAHRDYIRERRRIVRDTLTPNSIQHGTSAGYTYYNCRCNKCCAVGKQHVAKRREASIIRANAIVDAMYEKRNSCPVT